VQRLSNSALKSPATERRLNGINLVLFGDGRKAQYFPLVILAQNVADQVVLMKSLHYEDDAAGLFVIESAIKCVVVPGVNCIALGLRERFIGF
jgi:hypothetical protein